MTEYHPLLLWSSPVRMPLQGFIVQDSVIGLDLSTSKEYSPISFIISERIYTSAVKETRDTHLAHGLLPAKARNEPVTYWEDFDFARQSFEDSIFREYENKFASCANSISELRRYLRLCQLMAMGYEELDAQRILDTVWRVLNRKIDDEDDSDIVVELLKAVCLTYEGLIMVFRELGRDLDSLRYVLHHVKKSKFNAWGLWPGTNGILRDYNVVVKYFNQHNFSAVSVMLEHGIHPEFSEELFLENYKDIISVSGVDDIFNDIDHRWNFSVSKERMFLILQLIKAIYYWMVTGDEQCLETLSDMWETIPDPFITQSDISTTIHSSTSTYLKQCLDQISNAYTTVWPHSSEAKQPRTLMHLSRCAVRQRMAENLALPEGINELKVPRLIADYLRLGKKDVE